MATTSPPRHTHAVFKHRLMLGDLPVNGADPITIDCPRCGTPAAAVDRVGATIYGSHDAIGQCGWADTLTVGRDQHGAVTLT